MPLAFLGLVDVRECATAHLLALKKKEATNSRFALVNRSMWMTELATVLKTEFDPQGYNITNT